MFTKDYKNYLRSAAWKRKRQQAFKYYGRRCQVCGSTKRLEINHLTYEHLFNEPLSDLSVLCHGCHVRYTKLRRKLNRRKYSGRYVLDKIKANPKAY